jgi:hypothetical protein
MEVLDPDALRGDWRFSRVIVDRRLGQTSEVDGLLEISAERPGEELTWQETATWHRPHGDVAVRRALRLARTVEGWWVRFEDGRDFHPWRPGEAVVHDCAPDTYRGEVSGTPQRWTVTWEVTGPEKDYTMTTVLTPS